MNDEKTTQENMDLGASNAGVDSVEKYQFAPIKGYPMLNWRGKRPFTSTQYFPAQLKEVHGEEVDGWRNKIFWGDNLQVMSHLLKELRGKVDLVYIDPPFDSKADYKRKIKFRGKKHESDTSSFEEKQYSDIWTNDEFLQFMFERLSIISRLLKNTRLDAVSRTCFTLGTTAAAGVMMRGTDEAAGSLFSYVDLEERVPSRHPLRLIRRIVNDALASLDAEFDALYTDFGRPSIAPERLIRAGLLQILFSIRSERQLMEQVDYNLLFRWFVGLGIDDAVWVPTVFTKNRDRLLTTDMSRKVMAAILTHPEVRPLLSDEHFSVDGTLVKAWASMKSFQPKEGRATPDEDDPGGPPLPADETSANTDQHQQTETQPMPDTPRQTRNAEVNFRGEKRSNATHASVTDPDARLYKKAPGAAAMLCFMGHTLMENRNGLVVQAELTHADGHGERKAALEMINRHSPGSTRRLTLGADKGYDSADFVAELRRMVVTPHVAQKVRHSAIDGRTTQHPGYASSQRRRKKIEEPFGWAKTVGGMAQTLHRGLDRVRAQFTMTMAACNLARLPKLLAA